MRQPIDKLEPGMEVAADILSAEKMLLIAKGAVLNARSIGMLRRWGIESIQVVSQEPEPSETEELNSTPASPEALSEAEARINERFKFVSSHSKMVEIIKKLAVKRALRYPPPKPESEPQQKT